VTDLPAFKAHLSELKEPSRILEEYPAANLLKLYCRWSNFSQHILPLPELIFADLSQTAPKEEQVINDFDLSANSVNLAHREFPSITGRVIPEAIFSKRNYLNTIYEKIRADIAPYDPGNVLNPIWVNSRGAIPRFDRGSIEIRLMDIQECPSADMAIIELVIETIKALVHEKFMGIQGQMRIHTEVLANILDETIRLGPSAKISAAGYLELFGLKEFSTARQVWEHILNRLVQGNPALEKWKPELSIILTEGTLSDRILKSIGGDHSQEAIKTVYKRLAACLGQNKMFVP